MSQPKLAHVGPRKGDGNAPLSISHHGSEVGKTGAMEHPLYDGTTKFSLESSSVISSVAAPSVDPTIYRPASVVPSTPVPPNGGATARNTSEPSQEFLSAKQLFVEFLEDYLEIIFIGFQSRFGHGSDLILFRSPKSGSTLAVECDILLEPREHALQIIRSKLLVNEIQFMVLR